MKKSIFLFFAAILCSVGVWGSNFYSPYIYFNNAEYNWATAMLFVGHDKWSEGYNQTTNPITDTKLVYFEPNASWGDQTRFTIGNTSNWEAKSEKFDDRVKWMEHIGIQKDYDFNWHNTYYVTGTSSTINVQYISNNESEGYKSLPTLEAKQNLKIRNTKSDTYSNASGNWPLVLKLKGTYLSGRNASGRSEIEGTKSTDGNKYDAIVTGKITHTYTPSDDYHFEGWGTGDAPTSTNASYEYNITTNTTVYAFFTKKYAVNFSADANGSVTAKADEQALTSGNKVVGGTEVTLTATANTGYHFVKWSNESTTNPLTITVTDNIELQPIFAINTYTVEFLNYDDEVLQSGSVNHGETPVYNSKTPERPADARYTYTFSNWDNAITAATSDQTYKALFNQTLNQYTVTVNAENGTVTGAGTVDYGTTVTLTATPNTGYEFVNWTKAGVEVSTNAIYSFTVTENVDLVANFEALPPTITEYTRDVPVGYYATMCLPYASSNYTGVEIYEVAWMEFKDDKAVGLYLDQVVEGTTLEAGKPYIFKATAAQQEFVYEGKEVTEPVNGANGLRGTLTGIAAGNITNHYIIADNKFWVATANNWLDANRAYIDAEDVPNTEPAKLPGRRRVILGAAGENTETGVDNIITSDAPVKVIENGQLIIIRNGEKYNVQGVRL